MLIQAFQNFKEAFDARFLGVTAMENGGEAFQQILDHHHFLHAQLGYVAWERYVLNETSLLISCFKRDTKGDEHEQAHTRMGQPVYLGFGDDGWVVEEKRSREKNMGIL